MNIHGLVVDEMCNKCRHKAPTYLVSTCQVYTIEGVKRWNRLGKGCPMNGAALSIDGSLGKSRVGQQKQRRFR